MNKVESAFFILALIARDLAEKAEDDDAAFVFEEVEEMLAGFACGRRSGLFDEIVQGRRLSSSAKPPAYAATLRGAATIAEVLTGDGLTRAEAARIAARATGLNPKTIEAAVREEKSFVSVLRPVEKGDGAIDLWSTTVEVSSRHATSAGRREKMAALMLPSEHWIDPDVAEAYLATRSAPMEN